LVFVPGTHVIHSFFNYRFIVVGRSDILCWLGGV
jgi:hypothetical protein